MVLWQTFLITCYKGPKKDKEWQRCIQNKWNSAVLGCSFHKSHLDKQESRRTTFQSRGRAVPGRTPPALLAFRSAHGLTFCLGFRKCPGTIDTILWWKTEMLYYVHFLLKPLKQSPSFVLFCFLVRLSMWQLSFRLWHQMLYSGIRERTIMPTVPISTSASRMFWWFSGKLNSRCWDVRALVFLPPLMVSLIPPRYQSSSSSNPRRKGEVLFQCTFLDPWCTLEGSLIAVLFPLRADVIPSVPQ